MVTSSGTVSPSSRKDTTAFGGSSAKLFSPSPHSLTNFLVCRWPTTRWGRSAKKKVECAVLETSRCRHYSSSPGHTAQTWPRCSRHSARYVRLLHSFLSHIYLLYARQERADRCFRSRKKTAPGTLLPVINAYRRKTIGRLKIGLFLCLSSRANVAHALSMGVLLVGKRVAFPWSKPVETARSLFSTSIPSEDITSSERQCWLLHRFGLSLEFLVEVLRIDVQLLLGRLLRLGGGLGDLVCQTGFAEPDSFCLSCSPAHRVTIPYSHVATVYGHTSCVER